MNDDEITPELSQKLFEAGALRRVNRKDIDWDKELRAFKQTRKERRLIRERKRRAKEKRMRELIAHIDRILAR